MSAGFNLKLKIWRFAYPSDDAGGGAQPSGTVAYESAPFRLSSIEPDQVFLQQGLETLRTYRGACPSKFSLRERDEAEVVYPANHPYYGQRLRIDGISVSDFHPNEARGYQVVNLSRSVRAHASQ